MEMQHPIDFTEYAKPVEVEKEKIVLECVAEFDDYGTPPTTGRVEVRRDKNYRNSVVLVLPDQEINIITADRDQWGVWYNVQGNTIASEDGTRSFLDGLIKCLQELKDMNEIEGPGATITRIEDTLDANS